MIITEYRVVYFPPGSDSRTRKALNRAVADLIAAELADMHPIIEWRTIQTSDWTSDPGGSGSTGEVSR